ncbi:hypothetical protein QYF36_013487 [Acer negundo]|nr:hypothetical protein QYF36_013487 [Acer negundo]
MFNQGSEQVFEDAKVNKRDIKATGFTAGPSYADVVRKSTTKFRHNSLESKDRVETMKWAEDSHDDKVAAIISVTNQKSVEKAASVKMDSQNNLVLANCVGVGKVGNNGRGSIEKFKDEDGISKSLNDKVRIVILLLLLKVRRANLFTSQRKLAQVLYRKAVQFQAESKVRQSSSDNSYSHVAETLLQHDAIDENMPVVEGVKDGMKASSKK